MVIPGICSAHPNLDRKIATPPVSLVMCKGCSLFVTPDEKGICPQCGNPVEPLSSESPGSAPLPGKTSEARPVSAAASKRTPAMSNGEKEGGQGQGGSEWDGGAEDDGPGQPKDAEPGGDGRDRDYDSIMKITKNLIAENYRIYGLFGWALSGKSSFIFSTGKCSEDARLIEGYRPEGESWEKLYHEMAKSWASKDIRNTPTGHHHYEMEREMTERSFHVAFVDMSGEDFRNFNKNDSMAEFFLAYAPLCHGFIFMVNPFAAMDPREQVPDDVSPAFFQATIDQLGIISKFISNVGDLSAIWPKLKTGNWREARAELAKTETVRAKGGNRCNVPISICFSQADMWSHRVPDMRLNDFCLNGARVPLEHEAWEFMDWLSHGRLRAIMDKAPKLQVAWLSSLGREFNTRWESRRSPDIGSEFESWLGWRPEKPLGLKSVFDFVVSRPPKIHVKAANTYYMRRTGWRDRVK